MIDNEKAAPAVGAAEGGSAETLPGLELLMHYDSTMVSHSLQEALLSTYCERLCNKNEFNMAVLGYIAEQQPCVERIANRFGVDRGKIVLAIKDIRDSGIPLRTIDGQYYLSELLIGYGQIISEVNSR